MISRVELSSVSPGATMGLSEGCSKPSVRRSCDSSAQLNCRMSHIRGTLRWIFEGIQSSTFMLSEPDAIRINLSIFWSCRLMLARTRLRSGMTYQSLAGPRKGHKAFQELSAFVEVCIRLVPKARVRGAAIVEVNGCSDCGRMTIERIDQTNFLVRDHVYHTRNPSRMVQALLRRSLPEGVRNCEIVVVLRGHDVEERVVQHRRN